MRAVTYIYDGERAADHVGRVRALLADREEDVECTDVSAAADREAALRDAMLTVGDAVRVGGKPDGVFDEAGNPDFSAGVLITEAATGRRDLHVGTAALDALRESEG